MPVGRAGVIVIVLSILLISKIGNLKFPVYGISVLLNGALLCLQTMLLGITTWKGERILSRLARLGCSGLHKNLPAVSRVG